MAIPTQAGIRTRTAWLLNDTAQTIFTNAVIDPAIDQAYLELQSAFIVNGIRFNLTSRSTITVTPTLTGTKTIGIGVIPADIVWPISIHEGPDDGTDADGNPDFKLMTKVFDYKMLPDRAKSSEQTYDYWAWEAANIIMPKCTINRRLTIQYMADFPAITSQPPINSLVFLGYRAAAIAAKVISEDDDRAGPLNDSAQAELDSLIAINIQSQQSVPVRRRPYSIRRRSRWQLR